MEKRKKLLLSQKGDKKFLSIRMQILPIHISVVHSYAHADYNEMKKKMCVDGLAVSTVLIFDIANFFSESNFDVLLLRIRAKLGRKKEEKKGIENLRNSAFIPFLTFCSSEHYANTNCIKFRFTDHFITKHQVSFLVLLSFLPISFTLIYRFHELLFSF